MASLMMRRGQRNAERCFRGEAVKAGLEESCLQQKREVGGAGYNSAAGNALRGANLSPPDTIPGCRHTSPAGGMALRAPSRARGRPRLEILRADIERMLNNRFSMQEIADHYGCTPRTVSKRLRESGGSFRHYVSDAELLQLLDEFCHITENGRASGHRPRQAGLFSQAGVRPTRAQILSVSRAHDPEGTAARRERVLPRRTYNVTEPMVVWHIDSYEKLKPYGFYVHGGIDGGSNFVVYMTVALNKKSATLFEGYQQAINLFGRPLRLRADMCFEALAIGQDMVDHRGPQGFIAGPSTANQRIENY
ncbi:hypothetical protein WJX72_000124 [[Myrmecia] bisecta]|uniref:Integrase core domain-containing protein n=1 Tax=[Myrmecia] bisecta TaxID=41462 RepID=A0AAW1QDW1_9CHLO